MGLVLVQCPGLMLAPLSKEFSDKVYYLYRQEFDPFANENDRTQGRLV
jgi:hypothetical protein